MRPIAFCIRAAASIRDGLNQILCTITNVQSEDPEKIREDQRSELA